MSRRTQESIAVAALLLLWTTLLQWPSRSIGLFYDDFLVFRHYSASTVLHSWWVDLAVLTSPDLWVHVYRPMTLLVHALTFEIFGFRPDNLLAARILMVAGISTCLYVWVRTLEVNKSTALFSALLFPAFPPNFYAFTWNTEIGAISSLIWLLLSFIFATRSLQRESRAPLILSGLCWTLALLTKEVVVPLVVIFPVLWFFCGQRERWIDGLSFSVSFLVVTAIYVGVRFVVLSGAWGAQGVRPGLSNSLVLLNNYVVYLAWMAYGLPVRLARNNRLSDQARLLVLIGLPILFAPLACAGVEFMRTARALYRGALLAGMRGLEPVKKQIWLGAAMTLSGGLICGLYPRPRIMFAAAVGPVLMIGTLPDILRQSAGLKRAGVAAICVLVLGVNALYYFDLVQGRNSDFVRSRALHQVHSYFELGHLFEAWNMPEQAEYLRALLVDEDLVDAKSGGLREDRFREYLTATGCPAACATAFISRMQSFRGAYQK